MEWVSDSYEKDVCFIVANSQNESQFSQVHSTTAKRLGKLDALSSDQKCKSGRRENITERHPFSPKNIFSPGMYTRGRCVEALIASNGNGEPVSQSATSDQQASGDHHHDNSNHGDVGHADDGGAASGAGGAGGGGGGGGDDHNDDDAADDDGNPHEEDPIQETPPSTSSSSGNSVPQLIRPSASPHTPSICYPEHSVPHLEHPEMLGESEEVAGTSGAATGYVAESDSDEDGGARDSAAPVPADVSASVLETSEAESAASEATTAVVSDTDRYGQFTGERSATSHPSPVQSIGSIASQATVEAHPAELSSAMSTLSSLSSSSGNEQLPSFRPPKRRLPPRRGHTKVKRSRLDTSSTSTSTTDSTTTTTTTTTTTSDTSPERTRHQSGDQSHDPSAGQSPSPSGGQSRGGRGDGSHDRRGMSHDAPCDQPHDKGGLSQQDMFADDTPVRGGAVCEMQPPDKSLHVQRSAPCGDLERSHRSTLVGSWTHANAQDPPGDHVNSQDHSQQPVAASQDHLIQPRSQDQRALSQDLVETTSDSRLKTHGHLTEEKRIPLTPSEKLASLHLSGQSMVVTETLDEEDDDERLSFVAPSQEGYGLVPSIIPASLSADIASAGEEEEADELHPHQHEDKCIVGGCHGNKGGGGSHGSSRDSIRLLPASSSFQQWQSTFPSNEGSVSQSSTSLRGGCGRGQGKEGAIGRVVPSQDHDPEDHHGKGQVSQERGLVDYSGGSSQDLVLHFTQTQGGQSSRPMTQGSQAFTVASDSQHKRQPITSQAEHVMQHSSNEHAGKTASQHNQPIKVKMSKRGQILSTSHSVDSPYPEDIRIQRSQNQPWSSDHMTPGTGSSGSQSQEGFHLSIPKGGSQAEHFTATLTTFDPLQNETCDSHNSLPRQTDYITTEKDEKPTDSVTARDSVEMEDSTGARLNISREIRPSLVLDMINSDPQQTASQHSCTPTFHLDRPSLEGKADGIEEEEVMSVFQQVQAPKDPSEKMVPASSTLSCDSCIEDPITLSQSRKLHSSAPKAASQGTDKRRDIISVIKPRDGLPILGEVLEQKQHNVSRPYADHKDNSGKQARKLCNMSEGYDSMTQVYSFTNLRHRKEDSTARNSSESAVSDTKSLDTPIQDHGGQHQDEVVLPLKGACIQREPPVVDASRVDVTRVPRTSSPAEMSTLMNVRDVVAEIPPCPAKLDKQTTVTPPQVATPDRILRTTTIKTVLCRTITILEERVGGTTVSQTVTDEKLKTLSQEITHTEETIESPSPSRTAQSMTSGDLADISSISTTPSIPRRHSRLSSNLSKTGSKSLSSSSLPKVSPTQVSPSDGTMSSRSDPLVRRSSSSLASVAFSDIMSSTVNVPLCRRSSANQQINTATMVAATTNPVTGEQKLSDTSKPVEATHDQPHRPSNMDTMIFTNQWLAKETFGQEITGKHYSVRMAVIGQNGDQPPGMYPRRSSSSLAPSDVLFPDDDDGQKRLSNNSRFNRSASSSSSSSLRLATATFSTDADRTMTDGRRSEIDDHLFSRPGQPLPRRNSHMIAADQSKHLHSETPDQEKMTETNTNKCEKKIGNGEKQTVDEKNDSPGVAMKDNLEPSSAPKLRHSKTGEVVFKTGCTVLAKWKDHNYYPGHVICPGKRAGRYMVAFEDGNVLQVMTSDLIECDLVSVGENVFAETSDGWSEPAVIQGHYHDNGGQGYLVKFHTGVEARVPRHGVMLKHHQVESLVAAMAIEAQSTSEPAAPSTVVVAELASPLKETAPPEQEGQPPEKKDDGDHLPEEASKSCDYDPLPPQPACGTLPEGTQVIAKWQDKHYYPGHVTGCHPEGARYTVTFEDGDVLRVAMCDMFVCELLTVGQNVFADCVDGWIKPATVIGHYSNHDNGSHDNEHGYFVKFEDDGNTMSLPRSKVNLNSKQAAEVLRSFGGTCATPQNRSRLNVSLDNLVSGKRRTRGTPMIPSSLPRSSRKQRNTHAATSEKLPDPQSTPDNATGREHLTTPAAPSGGVTGKEEIGQLEPTDEGSCLREMQEETASTKKRPGRPALGTAEKSDKKRKLGPKCTSTPTPKRGRPRKLNTEGSASAASSTSKPARVTSSKKKIGKATPWTGPRKGRKGKLEEMDVASSTPTPEEGKGCSEECDKDDGVGPLEHSYITPQDKPKTVNKARASLFPTSKGAIPPKGSRLFQGFAFLLTHAEKPEDEKKPVKSPWKHILSGDSCAMEESGSEDEVVPFDKEHLIAQIEAGGGVFLEKFDLDLVHTAMHCFLVSDTYQRTLKYLHCLAADVACVSHLWVRDSCNLGALQDDKNYLLPAGVDVETNKIIERNFATRPLEGLHLMVSSDNVLFKEVWVNVLETAGCHLIHKFPIRSCKSGESSQLDLVVADRHISPSVLHRAQQVHIPLVSAEWIIQCLVSGRIRDCDAHPMYQHDYEERNSTVTG